MRINSLISTSLMGLVLIGLLTVSSCNDDATTATNVGPTVANALPNLNLVEGFSSESIDFSDVFDDVDGDVLLITAASGNTAVVTVSISGTNLTITEQGVGNSTITLTATDSAESVSDQFIVNVTTPANNAPTVANALSDLSLDEGFTSQTVDFSNVFSDADGDNLTYSASSSDTDVATTSISGTTLTITEQGIGTTTITLTANDGEAMVNDEFTVTVNNTINDAPTVANALSDISLDEGFGSHTIDISNVFADADGDNLTYSTSSSKPVNVATVQISGTTLTINEKGSGTATITVTASDAEHSVDDEFELTIEACPNDNSTATDAGTCSSAAETNTYTESVSGGIRTIVTNGLPNHSYTNNSPTASELNGDTKTFTVDATPSVANVITSIIENDRPVWAFGVGINGVKIDPGPAEPFIFENTNTGEYNWDWVFEPTNNTHEVALDCGMAHVQPDGTYHYHGDMAPLADIELSGLGSGTTTPTDPVLIGWAADGFPIVYKFGRDANGNIKELQPSYQLKSGARGGDGVSEPCGAYNGKYTNDYEYVSGSGDLDECNGISQSITINSETFSYYYVITDAFPVISRCFVGQPDGSLRK